MKILTIHSDHLKVEAKKKAIKNAEEIIKGELEVENCLVVLTAVEKRDESDLNRAAQLLVKEIEDVAKQVNEKTIVLYPYAHLSNELALPDRALIVLKKAEELLKIKKYNVFRAWFGWYKAFELKAKGHPLAELSREFYPDQKEEENVAVQEEKKLKSKWYILEPSGKLNDLGKFDFKDNKNLKIFSKYEESKVREVKDIPAHVKLMKKLELVDYEEASDPGNFRYYPKGRLIKSLIETYVTERTIKYGAFEVESPIMYNFNHPALAKYVQRFPARQYIIESDKNRYFLRFSACFGQFLIAHDSTISYKNLPYRIYELTRYSFRREQRGELTGLRRLRAFTMPDVHCMCQDMKQALEEYKVRFNLCKEVLTSIGFSLDDFELAFRVTKDFYDKNKELINNLVKDIGKPVLLEMWDERKFYFVLKYEFNFVDGNEKASALSTDQIDVENGERFDINFINKEGKKEHPLILHCSPSGAVERVIYALLEKAAKEKVQKLPLWLTPTQIRIIPVSKDKHLKFAEKLADEFENIRVDIDDNDDTINKRIRNAEEEWCSYILVVGDKEMDGKKLMVRRREDGKQLEMSKEELVKEIKSKTKNMPFKVLSLPRLLSKRAIFSK